VCDILGSYLPVAADQGYGRRSAQCWTGFSSVAEVRPGGGSVDLSPLQAANPSATLAVGAFHADAARRIVIGYVAQPFSSPAETRTRPFAVVWR
jgi:hypothetical protein